MKTYIALFRGINVGGKNLLPMKVLKELLESLDLQQVRTYIQSAYGRCTLFDRLVYLRVDPAISGAENSVDSLSDITCTWGA
jgi:hypothetical protein